MITNRENPNIQKFMVSHLFEFLKSFQTSGITVSFELRALLTSATRQCATVRERADEAERVCVGESAPEKESRPEIHAPIAEKAFPVFIRLARRLNF